MASCVFVAFVALLGLCTCPLRAGGALAGFSTSGVPCYLHPAADGCHYTLRPGADFCTTPSEKKRLSGSILLMNRTLTSLEQQLIRLGIIPPDNACSELPPVDNGGILYSDLNLPPGTDARYICNTGYDLHPLHDNGRYEFTCTEDGIWDGNVTEVPVECQLSAERCDPPAEILAGNISFTNGDPANILVGDVISYTCDTGTELHGPMQRYCLRNGNWSGSEPKCIAEDIQGNETISGNHKKDAIGAGLGSAAAVILVAMVATSLVVLYKCRFQLKRKITGHANLEVSDANSGAAIYSSVHTGSMNDDEVRHKPVFDKISPKRYRYTEQKL